MSSTRSVGICFLLHAFVDVQAWQENCNFFFYFLFFYFNRILFHLAHRAILEKYFFLINLSVRGSKLCDICKTLLRERRKKNCQKSGGIQHRYLCDVVTSHRDTCVYRWREEQYWGKYTAIAFDSISVLTYLEGLARNIRQMRAVGLCSWASVWPYICNLPGIFVDSVTVRSFYCSFLATRVMWWLKGIQAVPGSSGGEKTQKIPVNSWSQVFLLFSPGYMPMRDAYCHKQAVEITCCVLSTNRATVWLTDCSFLTE